MSYIVQLYFADGIVVMLCTIIDKQTQFCVNLLRPQRLANVVYTKWSVRPRVSGS